MTALRLTEKGYTVSVLEAGRRWAAEDFQRVQPVAPRSPAVTATAPGALRLPLLEDD